MAGAGGNGAGSGAPDDELETLLANRRRVRSEKSGGFCPQCGGAVQKSDRFCPKCGGRLEALS
jgi:predicted amidophosphoribosyltransferase